MSDQTADLPRFPLPTGTLVRVGEDHPLFWFDGLLPLPIGARIHLDNASGVAPRPSLPAEFSEVGADAVVVGVTITRLQEGEARFLALEVELHEPGWEDLTGMALQGAAEEAQAEEEVVEAAERITGTE
ncbi:MAG: hypothetical protein M3Y91_01565 [Actinomycetota bacterium]|nr:hypothetical protein [Actinomycetota bacterium]